MYVDTQLKGPSFSPISGGKAEKLIVFLHGLGADGNDLIGLAREFASVVPTAKFVSPDAPFACDMSPFGYQWFSLLSRDPLDIYAGLQHVAPIINSYIDEQLAQLGLTGKDLILAGFSQGTMLSLYLALERKNGCAGVLGYSGALVPGAVDEIQNPYHPRICLVHGMQDDVVPFESMHLAEETLTKIGLSVESYARPGLGHGIDMEGITIGKHFLQSLGAI